MKIVLFAYNFAHKKTQDFLLRMNLYGFKPALVIASLPVELNLPKTILRGKYRYIDLIHPRELCDRMNIKYIEIPHTHEDIPDILEENRIDIGVISGARILEKHVVESMPLGIVNFHPGLIPKNRGLHAVKWAIALNIPQGMTVHFIDEKVDRGRIIGKYLVPVFLYDDVKDINARIYELQVKLLIPSLKLLKDPGFETDSINVDIGYHPPADEMIDRKVMGNFEDYKNRYAYDKNGWICECGEKLKMEIGEDAICNNCHSKLCLLKEGHFEYIEIVDHKSEKA